MAQIIEKRVIKVPNGTLAKLCKKSSLTIRDLSKRVHIPEDSLNKFNRGVKSITLKRWEAIGDYLDTIK